MLGNKQRNKTIAVKNAIKELHCPQVNQTANTDDKEHGAITLQLVRAPSLN